MFNFKELKIADITLAGNTIHVKVEKSNLKEATCPRCNSNFLKKKDLKEVTCFDTPINSRYVKIIFTQHNYQCQNCEKEFAEETPLELGYYLTKNFYDKVVSKLSNEELEPCAKKVADLTGLSEIDAENLINIIMLEHFIQV